MDTNFEKTYYQTESTHWWGRTRRELIVHWISKFPKDVAILDIGCSGGALLTDLKAGGYRNLYGIDVSENAVALAREHGHQRAQVMDGGNITFDAETFDVVIASDCLEHLADDKAALDHWFRILKPGGTLIIFVPAFMFLWSEHDVGNHHCKRYSNQQLASLVRMSGFKIQRKGFWNFFLFPGLALLRLFQRLLPNPNKKVYQVLQPQAFINNALVSLMRIENKLLEFVDLPIGISTYVVARRPDL
jgi:2-polyprenyl-3-methyl-5-hydroxy-6-metoxy-1,4-benzoquinol methylase